jgi:hypothetical protein
MLRALLLFLVLLHGLIHSMALIKAISPGSITQLKQNISLLNGTIWLLTAILFISAAILIFFQKEYWWALAGLALIISQSLIMRTWTDARFGTIANILILLAVIVGFAQWKFAGNFREDVKALLSNSTNNNILTEQHIRDLPEAVKKYIRYTGQLGKNKTSTYKAEFEGEIRASNKKPWMKFKACQYSEATGPTRLFFIKATMKGLPVDGYHRYKNGKATMDIRALSLIKVQFAEGREMDIAETVTHFNDMCLLAPGSLIDTRIRWKELNEKQVGASFTNKGITINATLEFSEKGELINFISDDRYFITPTKQLQKARWMTPVSDYKEINGVRFPSYGEAVWVLPDGKFTYARMSINNIEINPVK